MSIAFVTFLGAFFTIVINVLGGARAIDVRYLRAAEMISGGGTQAGGGLGFFIWNSFMGGSLEQVVVGMISIGIAGYLSSSAVRALGDYFMPWRRLF